MNSKDTSRHTSSWLPNKGNVLFTMLALGVMLWLQTAGVIVGFAPAAMRSATSTSTINYQGYLADVNGDSLTGSYDMAFRIYDAPTGGNLLWGELWVDNNKVQVTNGLFSVGLGKFNTELSTIVQNSTDLYLGISVGIDGISSIEPTSELAPRSKLGSSTYAMSALTIPDGSITTDKLAQNIAIPYVPKVVGYVNEQSDLWIGGSDWQWSVIESVDFDLPSPPEGYRWDISWQFNQRAGGITNQGVVTNFLLDGVPLQDSSGNEFTESISLWRQQDDADNFVMGGMVYQNDISAGSHTLAWRVTGTGDSADTFLIRQRWLMLTAILVATDF